MRKVYNDVRAHEITCEHVHRVFDSASVLVSYIWRASPGDGRLLPDRSLASVGIGTVIVAQHILQQQQKSATECAVHKKPKVLRQTPIRLLTCVSQDCTIGLLDNFRLKHNSTRDSDSQPLHGGIALALSLSQAVLLAAVRSGS